ncbi:hypothetical protein [Ferrimonas senticii]|uniref:hypothetical protein n=1 Tax=Ferrimonas senticii TaxID=394566 RepID=UPI0004252BA5|nr:hypothetical protein [Ferrimonas senticii]
MSLFTTLICRQGQDTPARLIAIQLAAVSVVIIVAGLFYGSAWQAASTALTALLATIVATLSGKRRLNQAGQSARLLYPLLLAWLIQLPLQLFAGNWAWWGLLLPLLSSLPLLLLPNRAGNFRRQWGYSGPALVATVSAARVEPSLDGQVAITLATDTSAPEWQPSAPAADASVDWQSLVQAGLTQLKARWQLASAAAVVLLLVIVLLSLFANRSPQDSAEVTEAPNVAVAAAAADPVGSALPDVDSEVTLPDSFSLALAGNSLLIRWPADPAPHGELWSQLSGVGERSCAEVVFNNGNRYRPITVTVAGDDIYSAYFSALDTADLVYDVAMRGNFQLCGYRFSLKGTMAPLQAEAAFAKYTVK